MCIIVWQLQLDLNAYTLSPPILLVRIEVHLNRHVCMSRQQKNWCTHWEQEDPQLVYTRLMGKPVQCLLEWRNQLLHRFNKLHAMNQKPFLQASQYIKFENVVYHKTPKKTSTAQSSATFPQKLMTEVDRALMWLMYMTLSCQVLVRKYALSMLLYTRHACHLLCHLSSYTLRKFDIFDNKISLHTL